MDINIKSLGNLLPQSPQLAQLPAKVSASALTSLLQTGAQITAMVVQAKGGNQYLLEVVQPGSQNRVQVTAESVTALESGVPLQLEVVKGGSPPQVRVMPQQAGLGGTPVENALRQFLPKQQELSSLVNQLANFAKSGGGAALPADIQQLAQNLLASLPDKNTLANAEGLKQAVRDSGLFLESKLAQLAQSDTRAGGKAVDPSLPNDLKAKLLVLAEALSGRAAPGASNAPSGQAAAAQTAGAMANAQAAQAEAAMPNPQTSQAAAKAPNGQAPQNAANVPNPPAAPSATPANTPADASLRPLLGQTAATAGEPAATASAGQDAAATAAKANQGGTATAATAPPHAGEQAAMAKAAAEPAQQAVVAASLGATMEPALKNLASQAEGALAKMVLNQLASLPQPDANQQVWRFDIPFTLAGHPESARLEIEREANRDGEGSGQDGSDPESAPWTVTVELSPPGLGKFGGKVTLHQGAINAFFWSDDPATAELVQDNLPLLQARLEAVGLKTGRLDASMGVAPSSSSTAGRPAMPLLDLHV